ncbi:MAG: hypothetical protein PHT52_07625, partial [Eubacteriales bacterium]|nr:hypothetical protein [Eubacteriales bacterium]
MATRLKIFSFLLVITFCLGAFSLPASARNTDWTITFGPHIWYEEVVYGNDRFVAVGDGLIVSSVDGQEWTVEHAVAKDTYLSGVTWNGSMFVAVGSHWIFTSPDGKNWTGQNVDTAFYGVAWGKGQFVAVGGVGAIYTSPDGKKWTRQNSDCNEWLQHVEWGNGTFVAGGFETMLTSTDGVNWTRHEMPARVHKVRWLNGQFFAVKEEIYGEENKIYTSV